MTDDTENASSAKPKRTPYEKAWWLWLLALVGCFIAMSMNLTTAYTAQPVPMALFLLTFLMSALLGIYSLVLFRRLPRAMSSAYL